MAAGDFRAVASYDSVHRLRRDNDQPALTSSDFVHPRSTMAGNAADYDRGATVHFRDKPTKYHHRPRPKSIADAPQQLGELPGPEHRAFSRRASQKRLLPTTRGKQADGVTTRPGCASRSARAAVIDRGSSVSPGMQESPRRYRKVLGGKGDPKILRIILSRLVTSVRVTRN